MTVVLSEPHISSTGWITKLASFFEMFGDVERIGKKYEGLSAKFSPTLRKKSMAYQQWLGLRFQDGKAP